MYKIDIWALGRVIDTFVGDDINDVLEWYNRKWKHVYDVGLCWTDAHENGIEMSFETKESLGFA